MRVLHTDWIGIWKCWSFQEGGKLEYPGKTLGARWEPRTNSAHIQYDTRPESNLSHTGGRQLLSPLHQPGYPTNSRDIGKQQCSGAEHLQQEFLTLTCSRTHNVQKPLLQSCDDRSPSTLFWGLHLWKRTNFVDNWHHSALVDTNDKQNGFHTGYVISPRLTALFSWARQFNSTWARCVLAYSLIRLGLVVYGHVCQVSSWPNRLVCSHFVLQT